MSHLEYEFSSKIGHVYKIGFSDDMEQPFPFLCVSFDLLKAELIEANFFLVRKIINKFSPWLDEYIAGDWTS